MRIALPLALLLLLPPAPGGASAQAPTPRALLAELVAIDSSTPEGARRASEAMAAHLRAAGFPAADVQIVGPPQAPGNLVVYYRGEDRQAQPLLLMAHIDVVPALREDWTVEPFVLTERDGYFLGRGTSDNKAGVATLVANFIRLRREGFRPARDLILIATADEETTQDGIQWLLAHQPGVARAAFALNTDAGGGELRGARRVVMGIQASEKVYQSYRLEVRSPGGHSSRPLSGNAIYRLAGALTRLEQHRFPVQLNEVTRAFFQRMAQLGGREAVDMHAVSRGTAPDAAAADRLSANPGFNAQLRTTCVATMLEAGHAENALPQRAAATVNCRVLPGESVDSVDAVLRRVVGDTAVTVARIEEPVLSPPSPLTPEVVQLFERLTERHFPGATVIPQMSAGATDGLFVRSAGIPVYGVSAIFGVPGESGAHGQDERVRVGAFHEAVAFWYDLLRDVGGR